MNKPKLPQLIMGICIAFALAVAYIGWSISIFITITSGLGYLFYRFWQWRYK